MASLKDLRRRIRATMSMQQIFKAMEMVAAAKLRRAQGRAQSDAPYARKVTARRAIPDHLRGRRGDVGGGDPFGASRHGGAHLHRAHSTDRRPARGLEQRHRQPRARNPLSTAISRDEGTTWEHFRNVADAPGDAFAYPSVTFVGDRALLTYFKYQGGISQFLQGIPAKRFYE